MKGHKKITFKQSEQGQLWLLPPSLDELVPQNHTVRLVNRVIDGLEIESLLSTYKGGGTSSFHPKMMLKALVYAYMEQIYSSRRIEKALKENVTFMWLCGNMQPDHNTINRFRNGALKETIKKIFAEVLALLVEEKLVNLNRYHLDGTKIESVANRYSFVWSKNVERYKKSTIEKINLILDHVEEQIVKEEAEEGEKEQNNEKELSSERVKFLIKSINEKLEKEEDEELKEKVSKELSVLEKKHLPKLEEYEAQEKKLAGRNSYSKTDEDATFMRMKEDHMKNGQLKPAYNVQFGTENQFIINYTVHQTSTDTTVLEAHLEDTEELLASVELKMPEDISADAGYGSEENYEYMESKGWNAYVKYGDFHRETKKKHLENPFNSANWFYNEEKDFMVCPIGQIMRFKYKERRKTTTGFIAESHVYEAKNCINCPLRGLCNQGKNNKQVRLNKRLRKHKKKAKALLNSLKGQRIRAQRGVDVEPVFGHIKYNRKFNRFMLRSLPKVNIELGLIAIAHNLRKMAKKMATLLLLPPGLPPANDNWMAVGDKRPYYGVFFACWSSFFVCWRRIFYFFTFFVFPKNPQPRWG